MSEKENILKNEWVLERAIQFGEVFNAKGLTTPKSCSEDMLVVFKGAFDIWSNLKDQDDCYGVVGYFNEWMNVYLTQEFVDKFFEESKKLTMKQLNHVNETIKSWHTTLYIRMSPTEILKSQTNLIFFGIPLHQDMQILALEENGYYGLKLGDVIEENK